MDATLSVRPFLFRGGAIEASHMKAKGAACQAFHFFGKHLALNGIVISLSWLGHSA